MTPQPPSDNDVLATALIKVIKAVQGLDTPLGAVVLSNRKNADRIIAAIEDTLGVKSTRQNLLQPILAKLAEFGRELTRKDGDVAAALRANRDIVAAVKAVSDTIGAMEIIVDLTPVSDAIRGLETALAKYANIKIPEIKFPTETSKSKLGDNELRIAISLSESDIKKLKPMWQTTGPFDEMLAVLRTLDDSATIGTPGQTVVGATSTLVYDSDDERKVVVLTNDSDEVIYLGLGAAAQMNKGIRLNKAGGAATISKYVGLVYAICASGGKVLCKNELK